MRELQWNGAQNFKYPGFWYATLISWILYTFQDTNTRLGSVSRLRKKRGSSIDLDISHSKVLSAGLIIKVVQMRLKL